MADNDAERDARLVSCKRDPPPVSSVPLVRAVYYHMPMTDPEPPKRWAEKSSYLVAVSDETVEHVKHIAPAATRNQGPILEVLKGVLPSSGKVLEIASGTGQHVAFFAKACPHIEWVPSDPHPQARVSIAGWIADTAVDNVRQPKNVDVTRPEWYLEIEDTFDGMVCINLLHISPWQACEGLMAGARTLLRPGSFLYIYGPFMRDGQHTSSSNEEFDRSLKHRNPDWGLRDVTDVAACADAHGLVLDRVIEMPANNLSLALRLAF